MQLTIEELKQKFLRPLPGELSHLKMSPSHRMEDFSGLNDMMPLAKRSAVLVLLFPDQGQLKTVFIKRSEYDGVHSGQISFPGGQFESTDRSFEATAIRETYEEIGVSSDKIQLVGQLTDFYIPPSNFLVKVFVGYSSQKPEYIPDKKEVQSVIEVNVDDLYDKNNITQMEFYSTSRKALVNAPTYIINGVEIWGATAMIVSELLDVLK